MTFSTFFNCFVLPMLYFPAHNIFFCVALLLWALLTYRGTVEKTPHVLVHYVLHTLRNLLTVGLPVFFIYRVGANPALLMFWIDNFTYILVFAIIVCKLSVLFSNGHAYKYVITIFLAFGGVFLTMFIKSYPSITITIVELLVTRQDLVKMISEGCLSISIGTSFLTLHLWHSGSPKAPHHLLASMLLLGLSSFFAPFSNNVYTCLFTFTGYVLGACCYFSIKKYQQDSNCVTNGSNVKNKLVAQLVYLLTILLFYYTLGVLMLNWALALGNAVNLYTSLTYIYSAWADEYMLAQYMYPIEVLAFNNWWFGADVLYFLYALGFVTASFNFLSFTLLAKGEDDFPYILMDVRYNLLILAGIMLVQGYVVFDVTAECAGGGT